VEKKHQKQAVVAHKIPAAVQATQMPTTQHFTTPTYSLYELTSYSLKHADPLKNQVMDVDTGREELVQMPMSPHTAQPKFLHHKRAMKLLNHAPTGDAAACLSRTYPNESPAKIARRLDTFFGFYVDEQRRLVLP
jgi:hypothetical protein